MSRTLWLIAEDDTIDAVIRAIFTAKGFNVRVRLLGQAVGISMLAQEISNLIAEARRQRNPGDCIVVIHDADELKEPDRRHYNTVKAVCERQENRDDVLLIIAHDEIESWLLADEGLCRWLSKKPRNKDEQRLPSEILNGWLRRKKKLKWDRRHRDEVLKWVDGTGDAPDRSPSMKKAIEGLRASYCV
jgi:hypothetical protein